MLNVTLIAVSLLCLDLTDCVITWKLMAPSVNQRTLKLKYKFQQGHLRQTQEHRSALFKKVCRAVPQFSQKVF